MVNFFIYLLQDQQSYDLETWHVPYENKRLLAVYCCKQAAMVQLSCCNLVAACAFFVCKLVLWLLVAATLQLLVAAALRLLVAATLRLLVASCLRLFVCRECVGLVVFDGWGMELK